MIQRELCSIFRAEAVRRYATSQGKAVFPRLVSPRTFLYLWLSLGTLILAGGLLAWSAREQFLNVKERRIADMRSLACQ